MPRPTVTILMLLNDRWARGDVDRSGSMTFRSGASHGVRASDAVQAAVAAGGKPGKRVWVLSEDVWFGDVDLPPSATVGLNDAQLAEAAAYEAEAVGGLGPWEAVTSVKRVRVRDADDRYLTAQLSRADVLEIAKVLSKQGTSLAGVLHPAGLPLNIRGQQHEDAAESWSRVELWQNETVLVVGRRGQTEVHATGVSPTADWRRAVRAVMQASDIDPASDGSAAVLMGPGSNSAGGPHLDMDPNEPAPRWAASKADAADAIPGHVLDLTSDDAMRRFIEAWVGVLSNSLPDLPVLRKPKAPAGPLPQVLVGVGAFAVAAGVVFLQHTTRQAELSDLRAAAEHVQGDQAELVRLRQTSQALTREVRTKSQDLDRQRAAALAESRRTNTSRATVQDMLPRLASLLHTLSDAAAEPTLQGQFAIEAIRPQSPTHEIEGTATSSLAAAGLARHLSESLAGIWHVHPAEVTPITQGEAMAWRFSLSVEPTVGSARPAVSERVAVSEGAP